jgi:hypothetical protein
MKSKIYLLFILCVFFYNSGYAQQLGWSFDDVVRLKGEYYKIGPSKEGSYFVSYNVEKSIVNGKEYPVGSNETYLFDLTTNKVWRYVFLGVKREVDIVDIIEKNNTKYKKIDMGSKQNFYQWIDINNNVEYNLNIQIQLDDCKFILYSCTIK